MPDWLCSSRTCLVAGWLYDFHILVAGLIAEAAAIATALVIRAQMRQASKDAALHQPVQ